jgi:hypothetical protein
MQIRMSNGINFREEIHANFQPRDISHLKAEPIRNLAKGLDTKVPQALGLLSAIQAIFAGLSTSEEGVYRMNYTSAVQKLTAIFSFETCVALENYH